MGEKKSKTLKLKLLHYLTKKNQIVSVKILYIKKIKE